MSESVFRYWHCSTPTRGLRAGGLHLIVTIQSVRKRTEKMIVLNYINIQEFNDKATKPCISYMSL